MAEMDQAIISNTNNNDTKSPATSKASIASASAPTASLIESSTVAGRASAGDSRRRSPPRISSHTAAKESQRSLLDYLDQVEADISNAAPSFTTAPDQVPGSVDWQSASAAAAPSAERPASSASSGSSDPPSSSPAELASSVFASVKAKMASLSVQLKDREETVKLLSRALQDLKTSERDRADEAKRHADAQVAQQRREFEAEIARQLDTIERVLNEKAELQHQCEELANHVKELERAYSSKLEEEQRRAAIELKRQKESWAAAEKIRRENWIVTKTKQIKEATVRGLEPEIQRLISERKNEQTKAHDRQLHALAAQREELLLERERALQELRATMAAERESSLEREREASTKRLRDCIERYDAQMQEQRLRYNAEVERARMSVVQEVESDRAQLKEALTRARRLEQERESEIAANRRAAADVEKRRYERELQHAAEREKVARETWQDQMRLQMNGQLDTRANALKQQLTRERDAELEMVISRLTRESVDEGKRACESFDIQLAELKRNHELDLTELRTRARQSDNSRQKMEGQTGELEAKITALTTQLAGARLGMRERESELDSLSSRLDKARTVHEAEQAEQGAVLQQTIKRLRGELQEAEQRLRAREKDLDERLKELERRKEQEADALHARVRKAMESKDAIVEGLREQVASKDARIAQCEQLLDKQRVELMTLVSSVAGAGGAMVQRTPSPMRPNPDVHPDREGEREQFTVHSVSAEHTYRAQPTHSNRYGDAPSPSISSSPSLSAARQTAAASTSVPSQAASASGAGAGRSWSTPSGPHLSAYSPPFPISHATAGNKQSSSSSGVAVAAPTRTGSAGAGRAGGRPASSSRRKPQHGDRLT